MKMCIVFDTDDRQGMTNTVHIVDKLAAEYLGDRLGDQAYRRDFGKIEFIKMLRKFAQQVKLDFNDEDIAGLKYSKDVTDKIWGAKEGGKRLP
jgi:hypothetical protein